MRHPIEDITETFGKQTEQFHGFVLSWIEKLKRRGRACADDPRLFMAGDSIMAEYRPDEWPQYGWGQALRAFMKDPAALHNCARSGWSARRFRESGRWEKCIASVLKPGDWAIVSFGHNDMNRRRNKPPKNDYSIVDEYKAFLRGFAADAKAKGANIAFATSIVHSSGFGAKGAAMTVDGGAFFYAKAAVEMARAQKLPLAGLFKAPATAVESQLKGDSFEAAVWRGETAYVEIHEAPRAKKTSVA